MRKRFLLLLTVLAICMTAQSAIGAGERKAIPNHPILPYGHLDKTAPAIIPKGDSKIEIVTAPVLGGTGEWRIQETGSFLFRLYLFEEKTGNTNHYAAIYDMPLDSAGNSFSYTIREPGDYWLECYRLGSNNSATKIDQLFFTVDNKAGVETVASRVKDLVAECKRNVSGEYDIALWLHDWIINHSYYDLSYAYHGADSILFYGTGVCDSYSKLYLQLLQEAGIQAIRVSNSGHAWNAVRIDGEWCMIDATWDDPSGSTQAVSGSENHDYFGMNDELLRIDHSGYSCSYPCTSLKNYYLRRTGEYKIWLNHIWSKIEDAFQSGQPVFEVNTEGKIMANLNGSYYGKEWAEDYVNEKTAIAIYIMSEEDWEYQGGRTVRADFDYDADHNLISYTLVMDHIDLVLPESLTLISEKAFEGASNIYGVRLPVGAQSISSHAFAACDSLMWIVIPSDNIEIASDAFDDIPAGFIIVCHDGSNADVFAHSKGFAQMNLQ